MFTGHKIELWASGPRQHEERGFAALWVLLSSSSYRGDVLYLQSKGMKGGGYK